MGLLMPSQGHAMEKKGAEGKATPSIPTAHDGPIGQRPPLARKFHPIEVLRVDKTIMVASRPRTCAPKPRR